MAFTKSFYENLTFILNIGLNLLEVTHLYPNYDGKKFIKIWRISPSAL
jgi:hypothetical protein